MAGRKAALAAKIAAENPSMPMGQVMRKAGYSPVSSLKPKQLTQTKTFNELLEKYLPDEYLATRHLEFIESNRIIRKFVKGDEVTSVEETDPSAVKALDMAYKLKKRYGDLNVGQALIVQVSNESASKYLKTSERAVRPIVEPGHDYSMAQPSHEIRVAQSTLSDTASLSPEVPQNKAKNKAKNKALSNTPTPMGPNSSSSNSNIEYDQNSPGQNLGGENSQGKSSTRG